MGEVYCDEYITELPINCSQVQRKEPLAVGGWGLSEVTFELGFKRAEVFIPTQICQGSPPSPTPSLQFLMTLMSQLCDKQASGCLEAIPNL